MIERFSAAVETGKWPDGQALSEQQKESCIQAIMLYKARYQSDADEPFTISNQGEMITGKKIRSEFQGETANDKRRSQVAIDIKTDTSSQD
ncbi:MAG: DUF1315 family protein [Gammaproteobacteria bacterium]|nr:DUF1315 family protein [Gammaproteobacteria bacterium]